jgi:acyl-CoA thioesterase
MSAAIMESPFSFQRLAMRFHRDARVDEWLLYDMEPPSAQGARGLGLGVIFVDPAG